MNEWDEFLTYLYSEYFVVIAKQSEHDAVRDFPADEISIPIHRMQSQEYQLRRDRCAQRIKQYLAKAYLKKN